MTVDFDNLFSMRDAQLAEEVRMKAQLGWFDMDFTVYGCCYLEQGERKYRLSSDSEKIYDFIAASAKLHVIPCNVTTVTEKYPVPVGMQEFVLLDVKKELARQLRDQYPKDFFYLLYELQERASEDAGYPFLLKMKDLIQGTFHKESLEIYRNLLDYLLLCNKVSLEHYKILQQWTFEEVKNMEEEFIIKERYKKTFYGIAYVTNDIVKYITNARKTIVYKKQAELQYQGAFVSPIYEKTYYSDVNDNVYLLKKCFEEDLKQIYTIDLIRSLKKVVCNNCKVSNSEFEKLSNLVMERYGEAAHSTLMQYGYRWGIL